MLDERQICAACGVEDRGEDDRSHDDERQWQEPATAGHVISHVIRSFERLVSVVAKGASLNPKVRTLSASEIAQLIAHPQSDE